VFTITKNKVYILHNQGYQLVMETDLTIDEILDAIYPYYRKHKVLITDVSGEILFKTR